MPNKHQNASKISRRNFVKFGGAVIAGSTLNIPPLKNAHLSQEETEAKIKEYRVLGRTGFKVSDISMGTTRMREANVVRYAYDSGINYFDTAESYGNGNSEKMVGEALQFMDRKKVFITTKLHFEENATKEELLDRFTKCQERLKTDYVDALYIHSASTVKILNHTGFHDAVKELKAAGRLKHTGVSNHGPRGDGESMEKVLCAAAEDGRFDLMLLSYNFMNKEEAEKVLAACKKNNVGTTAMKTSPGMLAVSPLDPDNLTKDQQEYLDRIMKRGTSKEKAMARLKRRVNRQLASYENSKTFVEKHGIKTQDQLRKTSIHWVASNPDMHTTCVSFSSFDMIDMIVPVSGVKLSAADQQFLEDYKLVFNAQYCRHGCNNCVSSCPHQLPVSTIMRYAYYYEMQGNEKLAMEKYLKLRDKNASLCFDCSAPCTASCPHNLDIPVQLTQAHSLLTLV